MVYTEEIFSKMFCAILTKIKGVSIFVSIPQCPMDYCIPAYSTVFLLNNALLFIVRITWIVTVWNTNEDRNSIDFLIV